MYINYNFYYESDVNPITKTTYKELYDKTIKKELFIKNLGYNLITIWEYDWKKINQSINPLVGILPPCGKYYEVPNKGILFSGKIRPLMD